MSEQWAIVELMGHVRLAGRLSEEEHYGAKLGRLDIPNPVVVCTPCKGIRDANPNCAVCGGFGATGGGFTTQFFGGASVYRITMVSEDVARSVAANVRPAPVQPWEFPKPQLPAPGTHSEVIDADYEIDDDEPEDLS
ncbi:hypothetical protein [Sphingomonas sp.]|uniref:hypothetical protein n=1 Tax=Sphingomonas sp. TaxID=28214 RepID=UPI0025E22C2A|nr:hypothetical protein [Sphingomonas sp.]